MVGENFGLVCFDASVGTALGPWATVHFPQFLRLTLSALGRVNLSFLSESG